MRSSTKKLLMYGGAAAAAYYFFIRKPAPVPVPAGLVAGPAPAGALSNFGYFPSGSDTPFARIYRGMPTAWHKTHSW